MVIVRRAVVEVGLPKCGVGYGIGQRPEKRKTTAASMGKYVSAGPKKYGIAQP